jgi:glycosyltransferase involved in cell wall biosynthesis
MAELTSDSLEPQITVCICTRNRPDELKRAIDSISHSSVTPHQIVVSDDGDGDTAASLVTTHQLAITYTRGPHLGLGANRNRAIAMATGDYLLFLDDDATLGRHFLRDVTACLNDVRSNASNRVILTGSEINSGETITPNEQGLLGFQSRPYRPGERLCTVVINATLFPRELFDTLNFDPQLVYGFDEVDITTQAVALGFTISPCFSASNFHFPSTIGRGKYDRNANASRLYVTLKRRRWTERALLRSWVGFGLATVHLFLASIKRSGFVDGLSEARGAVAQAWSYYTVFVESRQSDEGPVE